MTSNRTIGSRYEDTWSIVQEDCMLCEMEKRTEWYLETPDFIVAEKITGGPFVVFKTHRDKLTPSEKEKMRHVVGLVFDDFEIRVLMNLVEDHWHGHIVTNDIPSLDGE